MEPSEAVPLESGEFIKTEYDSDGFQTNLDCAKLVNGSTEGKLHNYIKTEIDDINLFTTDAQYENTEQILTSSKITDLSSHADIDSPDCLKMENSYNGKPRLTENSESITVHVATVVSPEEDDTETSAVHSMSSQEAHMGFDMRRQTEEEPHECERFSDMGSVKRHRWRHIAPKPYKRDDNEKDIFGNLKIHMRTSTGEKPCKCDLCGKSFCDKGTLKTHRRKHTGEKPYECELCNKCFYESGHLKTHMKTHTGEKPYNCEHCGKSFAQSGHFKRHMRSHTGEKPHHCEHCGKSFPDKSSLTRHMRTHSGVKPYECEHCEKSFAQSGHLRRHMKAHTDEKQISVSIDGCLF